MDPFKASFAKLCALLRQRGKRPDQAEDLVQEAFVRLLMYTQRGAKVLEPEAFLTRTAFNLSVDHSRHEHSHLYERRAIEELKIPDLAAGPEEQLATEQYVDEARALLDKTVGQKTRQAFFMHSLEGLTYAEIGAELNLSGRSVERHIAKAVAVLSLSQRPRR